ncbi:MAG TPA: hypothetical protein VFC78_00575 [Tepidisphaeraceae bacterium]|nr:hypothetical protein [Tepidisphaeraceae bacterium]
MASLVLKIVSALSLALAALTAVCWIYSYRSTVASIPFRAQAQEWEMTCRRGLFKINNEPQRKLDASTFRLMGTIFTRSIFRKPQTPLAEYALSGLQVLLVFLVLPSARLANLLWKRHVLRYRAARCLCTRCGYDLRATPGRCPECGPIVRVP